MDYDKVMEFLGRVTTDLGATGSAGAAAIGNRLGLYRALAQGPATPEQFAARTGYSVRYLTEWLRGQAAGGYVSYEPATGEFSLTPEQAFCLADPNGPNVSSAFLAALGYLRAEPRLTEAFRTGAGVGWHEHHEDVFVGCDAFYRPGYVAQLVPSWIPALDGVEAKLTAGARVADLGCGLGSSSVLLGAGLPAAARWSVRTTTPSPSIWPARRPPRPASATGVSFEVATAQTFYRRQLRPGDDVRRPARHGRPGRRRPAGPGIAGPRTAPGCWSSLSPRTPSRRTSTRWAGCSTPARCSSACPMGCPSPVVTPWVGRPARLPSAR